MKALIDNNVAIGQSKSVFLKLAHDRISSAAPAMTIDADMEHLEPMIQTLAQNLAVLQTQLSQSRRFPMRPGSPEERRLAQMQRDLDAIAEQQNYVLNVLSGTFYSYSGNKLLKHASGMDEADAPPDDPKSMTPIVLPPIRSVSKSVSAAPTAAPSPSVGAAPQTRDLGLVGTTKFADLYNRLTTYQVSEEPLEEQAARTITQSADECNGKP